MGYIIGIDVGGTKMIYGLFDSQRKLLMKKRQRSNSTLSPEAFFDGMAADIQALLAENGLALDDLRGIGIGMPSYIRQEDGYIVKTTNLTNIREFPARDYLLSRLSPSLPIVLDNDAHTAALAEHKHGAGRGFSNMLYCPVSTGISSGIIIEGKLFRGHYGWSGESGHMIVTPGEGILCGCGNRGCLMSWCSGSMIVRHIQQWIAQGEPTAMVALAGSPEAITCEHLNAAWEQGDPMARRAVEQMARYMAVWTYNLYITFNIHCFVFGGGLLAMGEKLFGRMRVLFEEYKQDAQHPVHFKNAALGEDFGIIGAMELVL